MANAIAMGHVLTLAGEEAAAICAAAPGGSGQGDLIQALAKTPLARAQVMPLYRERRPRFDTIHLSRYTGTDYVQWHGRASDGHFHPFGEILQILPVETDDSRSLAASHYIRGENVETLRSRVAELEQENARLHTAPADAERERLAQWCEKRANGWNWAKGGDSYDRAEAANYRAIVSLLRTPAPEPQPAGEVRNHKLDTDTQVFFYEQDFYVLSNFSSFEVDWSGFTFKTSEHLYHWMRFALSDVPGAQWAAAKVKDATSAHEAFKLAQQEKGLQASNWDAQKVNLMREILRQKAAQHEYVRRKLLATGDRELIEDSWRDDFWGWGPNRDGKNMLGRLWMEIRAELREQQPRT